MDMSLGRTLAYHVGSVVVPCVVTAIVVMIRLGEKAAHKDAVLGILFFSFACGSFNSYLFGLALKRLARVFGASKILVWLISGAVLAPCIVVALALLSFDLQRSSVRLPNWMQYLICGPQLLFEIWPLTIIIGALSALFLYLIGQPRRSLPIETKEPTPEQKM